MKHTKEPWTVINTEEENSWSSRIVSRVQTYGERISPDHPWKDEPMVVVDDWAVDEIDARRIVACVNACEGITNEALEAGVIQSALINFEENLGLEKREKFCFYDIPVLEQV